MLNFLSNSNKFKSRLFLLVICSLFITEASYAANNKKTTLYTSASIASLSKQQDRARLVSVFKQTKKISKKNSYGLNKNLTQKMIQGTRAYHTRKNGNLLSLQTQNEYLAPSLKPHQGKIITQYHISESDSFSVAKKLINQGLNPLVLNMANKKAIGGGVEWGSKAQEECLFRASNYFLALYPKGQSKPNKNPDRKYYKHPIQEFGSYYTPYVQVFRDTRNNYAFIKPFSVACIAIAGYDLSKPRRLEKRIKNSVGIDLGAFKKYTKVKIRHLLEVALHKKHDSLVLGAISCGAFRLPNDHQGITARIVASAYKEVLQEPRYRNRFKNITFAVLPRGQVGKINYQVFDAMVQQL